MQPDSSGLLENPYVNWLVPEDYPHEQMDNFQVSTVAVALSPPSKTALPRKGCQSAFMLFVINKRYVHNPLFHHQSFLKNIVICNIYVTYM